MTDLRTQDPSLDPGWAVDRLEVTESGVTITLQRWPGIPNGWRVGGGELDRERDLIVRVTSDDELLGLAQGIARTVAEHRRVIADANRRLRGHIGAIRAEFGPPDPATPSTEVAAQSPA